MNIPSSINVKKLVEDYMMPARRQHHEAFRTYWRAWKRERKIELVVPPSPWTQDGRGGLVGHAFDYLIGSVWAKQSLQNALTRAGYACVSKGPQIRSLLPYVEEIIAIGPRRRRKGKVWRHRCFYRALCFLAELEAAYRAKMAPIPSWALSCRPCSLQEFRRTLRGQYPVEVVAELHGLLKLAREDLPKASNIEYNPPFGTQIGRTWVSADGDLLLDDLLLDLKTTKRDDVPIADVYQILSYAALDAHRGHTRIQRVGLYNPRFRMLWGEPIDRVAGLLGWPAFARFRDWFEESLREGQVRG